MKPPRLTEEQKQMIRDRIGLMLDKEIAICVQCTIGQIRHLKNKEELLFVPKENYKHQ